MNGEVESYLNSVCPVSSKKEKKYSTKLCTGIKRCQKHKFLKHKIMGDKITPSKSVYHLRKEGSVITTTPNHRNPILHNTSNEANQKTNTSLSNSASIARKLRQTAETEDRENYTRIW